MAKSFIVSPGRAYLVIAVEGTKIIRTNGTLIDTVPEGANAVSITVDTHEIIVMDNSAKIQQLYNGNSGSSGVMTVAEGEDAGAWQVKVVENLPAQGSAGVIYMLRTNRSGLDRYDDYIWVPSDSSYELLGRFPATASVDLSNVAKLDVANTFTKNQQINGKLTATSITVMSSLSCEQLDDINKADINYLNYDTATGSLMAVSRVTVLSALSVVDDANLELPGVSWRNDSSGNYIDVTRKQFINTIEVRDTAKVSNVLTLGAGNIELNGRSGTIATTDANGSVNMDSTGMSILSSDATLAVKGNRITMRAGQRTVFSIAQDEDDASGKFILEVSDGATLDGTVSMPGTLTVNNLNVTGTVTGITAGGGGGTTPTIDFSNGLTVMATLTANNVVAASVSATTLSAGASLSVSNASVIYRQDGVLYVHGNIVKGDKVEATDFAPKNIMGATFTGPLVMTVDNALQVLGQGNTAEIRNGNITGFSYAQFDQCAIAHKLTMDEGKARNVSVTNTLVVKDLVVTGTATGLPESGGGSGGSSGGGTPSELPNTVEGDLTVSGSVSAASVLAEDIRVTDVSTTDLNVSNICGVNKLRASQIAALDGNNNSHTDLKPGSITVASTEWSGVGDWRDRTNINPGRITLSSNGDISGVNISVDHYHTAGISNVSVSNVLMYGEHDGTTRSDIVVLRVPAMQLGDRLVAEAWNNDPSASSSMIALYNGNMSSMCGLRHKQDEQGVLQLQAFSFGANHWSTIAPTLRVGRIGSDPNSNLSVMSMLVAENGLQANQVTLENVSVVGALYIESTGGRKVSASALSVVDTLTVTNVNATNIIATNISAPNTLTAAQKSLLGWLADNKSTLESLIARA